MKKPKLLCILHQSPPVHGAAKVGDQISRSIGLRDDFVCNFIRIKSATSIENINKFNFFKIYFFIELFLKVLGALITIRPDKIYFTASASGLAFYRDFIISLLFKVYSRVKKVDIFYHYHTKGINNFILASKINFHATNFFLKDVNLILLSPYSRKDLENISTYKQIFYLPNGVQDAMSDINFDRYIKEKFQNLECISILFLSSMIKSKGYFEVLKLAKYFRDSNIHFNFAGSWGSREDELDFFRYVEEHSLDKNITYHGFLDKEDKDKILKNTHILCFPSRYQFESFPLVAIESLSYGIPAIVSDEASLPLIINSECGIVVKDLRKLPEALNFAKSNLLNVQTSAKCRQRFLNKFTLNIFESNFIKILKETNI